MIRIFPNRELLQRLMGALLINLHEGWLTGRLHLSPESIQEALIPVVAAQPAGYPAGFEDAA